MARGRKQKLIKNSPQTSNTSERSRRQQGQRQKMSSIRKNQLKTREKKTLSSKAAQTEFSSPKLVKRDEIPPEETTFEKMPTCTICLDTSRCRKMKFIICGHSFHEKCIDEWLTCNITCPICRVLNVDLVE